MTSFFLVAIGGMTGAISRYVFQKLLPNTVLPISTIAVNLLGSFTLGWIVGTGIQGNVYLLAATGFMGAFTTFSTLNVDLIKLLSSKHLKGAILYFFTSYIGGLLLAAAGLFAGRTL